MDSPLLALFIVFLFGSYALIVESQVNLNPPPPPTPAFTSPSPPPPPPPPPILPQPPRRDFRHPPGGHGHVHGYNSSHRFKKKKLNTGKKVGLMFIGIGAILQVCVVTLLVIRRRQIFKDGNV